MTSIQANIITPIMLVYKHDIRLYSGYYDQHNVAACLEFADVNTTTQYSWSDGKPAEISIFSINCISFISQTTLTTWEAASDK